MSFPHYNGTLDRIAQGYEMLLLDNIFPLPVRQAYALSLEETDSPEETESPYLADCTRELQDLTCWMQQQGSKVKIPWKIHQQGWKGYGCLTKAGAAIKESPRLKKQFDQLLTAGYRALTESRRHIFSLPAAESGEYLALTGKVNWLAKEYCLKKENHAQDHGADEELASSGIYLAHRGSTAIVTLDRDIESIVRGYDKLVSPRFTPTVYRLRPYDA